ncbi:hypothetical protein [Subtercola boreus]|uniref:Right handed beta helix domain-containing protein n=1 Tax=Subtercola boreus TaxID=120213 RepID=A0A3E0WDC0_9MICO|nr:hypothetical protein [Subtercola boreus]RFA20789.1 hypothetical protein B7R24_08450 [Subtercola boreus]RFA20904.1 hypothetical protein B7R23_08390 [Subtercola boreus]RFA27097.1 hypothetical protein B7R25_08515 [Subtercola boreus]
MLQAGPEDSGSTPAANGISRRNILLAAAATAGVGAAVSPVLSQPSSAEAATVVGDQSRVYYPEQFGFKSGDADHTVAMNAFFLALMKTGGHGYLPPGDIRVRSTGFNYDDPAIARQVGSGVPYGFPEVIVEGYGRGVTRLRQISGSTGDAFVVKGKTGTSTGPGANNKARVTLKNFSIFGTSAGRHGIYTRSLLHSRFVDLEISGSGKAGIFAAREVFTAANDEYSYANVIDGLRIINAGSWGYDCDGINAIDVVVRDTEIINCISGGVRIAPTNARFDNVRIIGCGQGNKAGRGFLAIPTTNTASSVSELNINGIRLEGNSALGGYQLELSGGVGATVNGYNIVTSGDKGAHGIGVGVMQLGGIKTARNSLIGRGTMFMGQGSYPSQRAVVVGPDGLDSRVELMALPNDSSATFDDVVANSGVDTVDQFGKPVTTVPWKG